MYYLIWEYEVEPANESEFKEYYSRSGPWFKFFEPCDDYLGHDLLESDEGGSFIIIDKWMGKEEYSEFMRVNQAEYERLNTDSSSLDGTERLIGAYHALK